MRITLVIDSLGAGGAQRVMTSMARVWAEEGRKVTLITLDPAESDFFELHPAIERIALGVSGESKNSAAALRNNMLRTRALRAAIAESRPDAVISFIDRTNVLTLLAVLGLRLKVIVSERVHPQFHSIGLVWAMLRRIIYPTASALVVQTQAIKQWAERLVTKEKIFVVPNPVLPLGDPDREDVALRETVRSQLGFPKGTIIAIGRLTAQKGFDLLIRAFAKIASSHADWALVIVGEGEERNALQKLSSDLGISNRVHFLGVQKNAASLLANADLFIMPSRFEGFPNVLLEAMACGLPVISFDCPSGPGEIIRHQIDGLLVPPEDVGELANAMSELMMHPDERAGMGTKAKAVIERFCLDKIMQMWDDILKTLAR